MRNNIQDYSVFSKKQNLDNHYLLSFIYRHTNGFKPFIQLGNNLDITLLAKFRKKFGRHCNGLRSYLREGADAVVFGTCLY